MKDVGEAERQEVREHGTRSACGMGGPTVSEEASMPAWRRVLPASTPARKRLSAAGCLHDARSIRMVHLRCAGCPSSA